MGSSKQTATALLITYDEFVSARQHNKTSEVIVQCNNKPIVFYSYNNSSAAAKHIGENSGSNNST